MDLYQALRVMGSDAFLNGESSHKLSNRVKNAPGFTASGKMLLPAHGLKSGVVLRPVEALHQLAYVTSPRYQDDVFDMYQWWGLLRYLGFFDLKDRKGLQPELKVSDAGGRIVGNQRRVTSEEIGIALGATLARRWFAATGAGGAAVRIADVDAALDDGYVLAGGARRAVRKIGKNRPDYILVADDPVNPGRYRIRVLECKGTKSPSTALRQLAKAVRQLDGITVDGRVPFGLATAAIAADDALSYLAIDPADEDEPTYEVDPDMIDEVRYFRMSDYAEDLPSRVLASAAIRASWAMLADFGRNTDALASWAPEVMRTRPVRRERIREEFVTPFGDAAGISVSFRFDKKELVVKQAVAKTVDEQLRRGTAGDVITAQARFAEQLAQPESQEDTEGSNELCSATSDGSIFSLSIHQVD